MSDTHETTTLAPITPTYIEKPAAINPLVAIMQSKVEAPTLEMMSKWMDLQERYEEREAEKAYTVAMAVVKPLLPVVVAHDTTVEYGTTKFTHASLPTIMKDVVPILSAHGFVLKWIPSTPNSQTVTVECRITHAAGHQDSCTISAPPDAKGGKNAAQAVASTIKLLERYTAEALLGITDQDIDEIGIQKERNEEKIDINHNLKALASLAQVGINQREAEGHVKKSMEEWNSSDIEQLRQLKASRKTQPREPGQEG
jgi:hypothetical protein